MVAPASPSPPSENPGPSSPSSPSSSAGSRIAILVFVGTLLGSLIGAVADLTEALEPFRAIYRATTPTPHVRVVGSSTILGDGVPVAKEWQEAFLEMSAWTDTVPILGPIERNISLEIEPVGSLEGFKEAEQGTVHVLAASEPVTPDVVQSLTASGITFTCAGEIGYDIITLVTDVKNELQRAIQVRELSSILTGDITDWAEVGGGESRPIRVLVRRGSGTTDIVLKTLTGASEWQPHFIECHSNSQCLDLALSIPGSLYWVSKAWLQTQPPRYLRAIPIQRGQDPSTNPLSLDEPGQTDPAFNPDHYPRELMRPLYMYVLSGPVIPPESTDYARQFFQYVRGVRGQETLETHHFRTYFDAPAGVPLDLPEGFGRGVGDTPVVCKE